MDLGSFKFISLHVSFKTKMWFLKDGFRRVLFDFCSNILGVFRECGKISKTGYLDFVLYYLLIER